MEKLLTASMLPLLSLSLTAQDNEALTLVFVTSDKYMIKIIKTLSVIILTSTFSCFSYGDGIDLNQWSESTRSVTSSVHEEIDKGYLLHLLYLRISHGSDGRQRIYFHKLSREFVFNNKTDRVDERDLDTCNPSNLNSVNIIKIGNQAIKAFAWCNKIKGLDANSLMMTAETERGHKFILDSLYPGLFNINVEVDGISFSVPSAGFSKAWRASGGNAL